mgnify:CR=1 FL=1
MFRNFSFGLMLIIGSLIWSQEIITTTSLQLNGKVKQVETYQVEYEEVFGKYEEKSKKQISIMKFDSKGYLSQNDDQKKTQIYSYDSSDKLLTLSVSYKENNSTQKNEVRKYKYSNSNEYETEIYNDKNVLIKKEVSKRNNPLQEDIIVYDQSGKQSSKRIYYFDNNGNRIKAEIIDKNGTKTMTTEQEYDLKNNLINTKIETSSGISYYEENEILNNLIQKNIVKSNFSEDTISVYNYELDSQNNWIKKTFYIIKNEFGEDKKILQKSEIRVIEYF